MMCHMLAGIQLDPDDGTSVVQTIQKISLEDDC
jgi:hypothetical protein